MRVQTVVLLAIGLVACAPSVKDKEEQREAWAGVFESRDRPDVSIDDKCRATTELAALYETGHDYDVYPGNQWKRRRDAYCSTAPDPELAKKAVAALKDFTEYPAPDGRNRCAQHSLVTSAYQEARDAKGYNEWRMKTKAFCDEAGYRWAG